MRVAFFSREVTANSVDDGNTTVLLPGGTYLRKPVHQPVRWHECTSRSKAYETLTNRRGNPLD